MTVRVQYNLPRGLELDRVLKEAKKNALITIGIVVEEDTKKRFEEQGPDWEPLKPATIAAKGSSAILIDTGLMLNSIESQVNEEEGTVKIGIFKKERALIALVHELGSPSRNIPARPFMIPAQLKNERDAIETVKASYQIAMELKR